MKTLLTFYLALFVTTLSFFYSKSRFHSAQISREAITAYKNQFAFSCSPNLADFDFSDSATAIPLLEGWGNYRMPVTAANDSSKIYFEQGINMYYAFHMIESLASFEKAILFDSNFAMGYWGKALAYGPNINDYGYSASPNALTAMKRAKELSGNCTPVERGLIDAIQVCYSEDTTQTREVLNQRYADAMQKVHANFPQSTDAATLYVDALMVQHPWDLYTKTYEPKPWTPLIVNTLETILKTSPNHPGAVHYYIHAIEASAHPEKALEVAKRLPLLMPGVSHVVHMPSHIYIRSGYYNQGENLNKQAVKSYYNYASRFPAVSNNKPLYLIHNLHMQASCASMDGNFKESITAANDCRNSFDSSMQSIPGFFGVAVQYVYMTPYLTLIRFGKWDDIVNTPENPASNVYADLLWHYGQGMAYARKHDFAKATEHLNAVRESMANNGQLKDPAPSFANAGIAGAGVAEKILDGVIAEEKFDLPKAVALLQGAVTAEDSMVYNEPRDWMQPARQYLGNVLLKAKKYAEAEQIYKEDLRINPHNGWSLTGLYTALAKEGKKSEAANIKAQAAKAFAGSDANITASVF